MRKKRIVLLPEMQEQARDLIYILLDKGYFSSAYYAHLFVKDIICYIRQNAAIAPKKSAPAFPTLRQESALFHL